MTDSLEAIWAEDRLDRKAEAELLQRFLVSETVYLENRKERKSIVLGLDAPYGIGKSFFLERFVRQIKLNHPVAFVDAWADDTNDEPLVAFMASINEALEPFLKKSAKVKSRLQDATRAALPIVGKVAWGAGKTFVTKWVGHEAVEGIAELTRNGGSVSSPNTAKDDDKSSWEQAADDAGEAISKEVEDLVDKAGAAMLEAYRQRKQSRAEFKRKMAALVDAIRKSEVPSYPPLFVVIDELDRCRPDYAIRVLEEIKHFFDVPGVVFVIALHGDQLARSVGAVYGPTFDGGDYLRRFFTRKYRLREPSLGELAAEQWTSTGLDVYPFRVPKVKVEEGEGEVEPQPARFVAMIVDDYFGTSRELIAVIDMIRIFNERWNEPIDVDLLFLTCLAMHFVRDADPRRGAISRVRNKTVLMSPPIGSRMRFQEVPIVRAFSGYFEVIPHNIDTAERFDFDYQTFATVHMLEEFYNGNRVGAQKITLSRLTEYETRLRQIDRFLDKTETVAPG